MAVQVATSVLKDNLNNASIRTGAPMQLGWRNPEEHPAKDARYQDIRLYAQTLTPGEVRRLPFEDYVAEIVGQSPAHWTTDQWHVITEYYLNEVDASYRRIQSEIASLDEQLDRLSAGGNLTLVSWEKSTLPYAHVLTRGVYTARTERVEANTPHFLPPLPKNEPQNRLALAKWTVSAENPLTARVTVNRMWYELFGTGLVETTEDFGIMGQRPSHPELLDWLAVEFRESGWNIKHMYKLMVMSATYRQSSKVRSATIGKRPQKSVVVSRPAFPHGCRDGARRCAAVGRTAGSGDWRTERQAVSAGKHLGAGKLPDQRYPCLRTGPWRSLYRRSMYSYGKRMASSAEHGCIRRPNARCGLHAATANRYSVAGPGNHERCAVGGGCPGPGRARDSRGRAEPRAAHQCLGVILLSRVPPPQMAAVLERSLSEMQKHYTANPKDAACSREHRRDECVTVQFASPNWPPGP